MALDLGYDQTSENCCFRVLFTLAFCTYAEPQFPSYMYHICFMYILLSFPCTLSNFIASLCFLMPSLLFLEFQFHCLWSVSCSKLLSFLFILLQTRLLCVHVRVLPVNLFGVQHTRS